MWDSIDTYALRLALALAAGALIGLEREFRGKAAGMRTNTLICVGSCLLMIISIEIANTAKANADPSRIASQVVTGIGFLGAGAIIRSHLHVSGLTTAATIWALASLGLTFGAGFYWLALLSTGLIFLTLTLGTPIERALRRRKATRSVELAIEKGNIYDVLTVLRDMKITPEGIDVERVGAAWKASLEFTTSAAMHHKLLDVLSHVEGVTHVIGR
jgi:putative Mg2+ transporter-C (MgtC) family protein